MSQKDIDLLEKHGWEVNCESPFEISHTETGDTATGIAARIVLIYLALGEEDE